MFTAIQDLVKRNPYFTSLSDRGLAYIATLATERSYAKGDYLFLEGEPAQWCGLIVEGQVKLVKHSDTGKDLVLDVLGPDRFVGITPLLGEGPCTATGQAMEFTRLLAFDRRDFVHLLRDYPAVCLALLNDLSLRLEEAYNMMRSLALERVERRVAMNLVKLAGKTGVQRVDGSILIDLPLTRQDIADMSGTTIETAIRTMSKFQKQGLLESEDGRVRLLKPHQLVLIAEDIGRGEEGLPQSL